MKINEHNIILDCNVNTKKELLTVLSNKAFDIEVVNDSNKILYDFLQREDESSTGLENNFAIPHAKSESVIYSTVMYIRNKKIIKDWETFDNKGVNNIFALLIKKEQECNDYLSLLSNLAIALMEDNFKNNIKKLDNKELILNMIHNALIK